ncbi:MAG: DUF3330 domain-containing protein [Gammaproteobacteria bacterium]|nr:DUF3330 domain-containing protein [Gammaproteobacteria bacterium]MBU1775809.1 DUF3330 domain-containing protein [Gammaproteobacteria bacterium]MBU1969239.1 DUF3330 domain-containing protein [Gammaproteobacteria bacterium]
MTTRTYSLPVAGIIPCDVCHKEIPLSEAKRFEAADYVAHFCGLDCYTSWKERSEVLERKDRQNGR